MADKKELCKSCGTELEVEREVFSRDKLFIVHSCKAKAPPNQREGA